MSILAYVTVTKADQKPSDSKNAEQPQDKGVLGRMLSLAWQYRSGLIVPLIVQVALLVIGLIGLTFTGLGLDIIVHTHDPSRADPSYPLGIHAFDLWQPLGQLVVVCIAIIGFSVVRGCLNITNSIAISKLIQGRLVVDLRAAVYDKLQRLSFRFYDNNETGSIINRVTGDVQTVSQFISGVILQVIMLTLSLIVYIIYMIRISPMLTLACLISTPILWYGSLLYARMMKIAYRRNRELYDKLILVLSENLGGIHVVKGFSLQKQQTDRFVAANTEYRQQQRWIFWRGALFGPSIHYITQINLGILLLLGGAMVIRGQLALGTGLWVFIGLLSHVSGQVQAIAQLSDFIQRSLVAARRVYDVLDAPLEIQSPPNPIRLPKARGKLEFRNVSFEFTPGKPILRDITFTLQPGSKLAILGPTGSGKSVMLSLMSRFYDPSAGQIFVDDIDIRQYDLEDLRRSVGLVFQETFLFSNTIASNIAFGHPQASRERIESAARQARAHDFIVEMPKGYDSLVAEGGNNLSGGQKQRLAIARALILQPSFLLMDDPMAAVDAQTEQELLEAMDSAMTGRTTIIIANRISTLRHADYILVMQKGRVIQRGTHQQLMTISGHYRETARLQLDEEARKTMVEMRPDPSDSAAGNLQLVPK